MKRINNNNISTIGIIGAGTMGSGIASVCALRGFKAVLYDISKEIILKAEQNVRFSYEKLVKKGKIEKNKYQQLINILSFTSDITNLSKCNLIIEAAVENFDIKCSVFKQLNDLCKEDSIFSTNTSSLSVSAISSVIKNKSRFAGLHFFNPPALMKLVEVVKCEFTSVETVNYLIDFCKKLGKTPVTCNDTPAFIVNRIARSFYGESLKILGEGNITYQTIDNTIKKEGGFAMGPFELMDLIGLDVNYSVTKSVYEAFFYDTKYKPHPIQRKMVEAGLLGKKTGMGFYYYKDK